MRTTIARPFTACGALLTCCVGCGDTTAVDPSATDSTGAATTTGTSEAVTPTGSTAPETSTSTEPVTTTGEPPSTTETTSTGGVESTTSTSTTTTGEGTSTGTTAGDTDDTGGALCEVSDETAGGSVDWARHFGSPFQYAPQPHQLAVGALGEIAIAQAFRGEFDFGGGPMQTDDQDGFFALFDAQGEHLASAHLDASPQMDVAGVVGQLRVALGPAGEVYLAGSFSGELAIGGDTHVAKFGTEWLADIFWATYDVLLVKFAPDGTYLWSRRFGDAYSQEAFALAVTPTGNVVIGGPNKGEFDVGGDPLGVGDEKTTGFLAEFTPDGDHVWSRSFGPPFAYPVLLSIDPAGRISAAGAAASGADLGGGPLPPASNDQFIAQFDATGAHRWSRRYLPHHDLRALVADATGAVMVTGLHVPPDLLEPHDMNLARFAAADGALVWNKHAETAGRASSRGLALTFDLAGDIVVGGNATGAIDLGDGPIGSGYGMFLAGYDTSGALLWQRHFGAPLYRAPEALVGGPAGELVFTGTLEECADLGSGAMHPVGLDDILLVRLSP
ncbi:hypothetical protein [Nannocystis sp. SCPEA4]|uniref:hypothetical protein n=1 Tax=Nannocystis sp. SCPEA4 TaxID=2996787 RepID=UPI00227024BB|nr:hypothetical protein [Nannocystis sp. SCPEA4]MCY1060060.1 hypothetical protein [Nannocystis sp. SCPEA4]